MENQDIVRDVEHALQSDSRLKGSLVRVASDDSKVVSLSGQVDTYSEKIIAEEITSRVRGVRDIINSIIVLPRTARSDEQITELVRKNIRLDVWLEWARIDVETIDGIVFLRGVVRSGSEKNEAENDARWVAGVIDVINHLQIKPEVDMQDSEILRDIRSAIQKNSRLDLTEIEIDVTDGIATLTGVVSNYTQKRVAEFIVFSVPGVIDVINELYVPAVQRPAA